MNVVAKKKEKTMGIDKKRFVVVFCCLDEMRKSEYQRDKIRICESRKLFI